MVREVKLLVYLGAVQELQSYLVDDLIRLGNIIGELDDHVRVTVRNDEAVLQNKVTGVVDTHEGTAAVA